MEIHGVVAEFNPFHNGHKYLLEKCREKGASHVVVAMSGNFVQRGKPAIMDKWARARCALLNGADLVVEIPIVWSLSSAENFARGGVEVLNALGCVEELNFGSESDDVESLKLIAQTVVSDEIQEKIKKNLNKYMSYPKAREKAVASVVGKEVANRLKNPNDILGVEYIKAINAINSKMEPCPIKRVGPEHDSNEEQGEYLSATQIRRQLISGDYRCFDFVPKEVEDITNTLMGMGRAPVCISQIETSILSKLRVMDKEDIKRAPDVTEGLENRIYNCVKCTRSLKELYGEIKTKRYTYARIRRIIMDLFLNINSTDVRPTPPYVRVLGFNEKGQEILKQAKLTATLPVITKPTHIKNLDDKYAQRVFELECSSTDIFTLAMPESLPCGLEMTENIVII